LEKKVPGEGCLKNFGLKGQSGRVYSKSSKQEIFSLGWGGGTKSSARGRMGKMAPGKERMYRLITTPTGRNKKGGASLGYRTTNGVQGRKRSASGGFGTGGGH